jgi:hypothetical protein
MQPLQNLFIRALLCFAVEKRDENAIEGGGVPRSPFAVPDGRRSFLRKEAVRVQWSDSNRFLA